MKWSMCALPSDDDGAPTHSSYILFYFRSSPLPYESRLINLRDYYESKYFRKFVKRF